MELSYEQVVAIAELFGFDLQPDFGGQCVLYTNVMDPAVEEDEDAK